MAFREENVAKLLFYFLLSLNLPVCLIDIKISLYLPSLSRHRQDMTQGQILRYLKTNSTKHELLKCHTDNP